VPWTTVFLFLCWLAVAAQLAALTTGRYAPYPAVAERPPRGPIRESVRVLVLAARARRAGRDERQRAAG